MRNIAKYTLIEAFRGRLYLVSLIVVILIAVLSHCGAQINDNFSNPTPATLAFGMFFAKVVGLVFLLVAPVFGLASEVESGTIQFTLARSTGRAPYLLAKYVAYLILYAGLLVLAATALGVVTTLFEKSQPGVAAGLALFVFSEFLSGAMLLAIVFAIYTAIQAPVAAAMLAAIAFFMSLMLDTAKAVADTTSNTVVKAFYLLLYYAYPGFRYFNLEKEIVYHQPVEPAHLAVLVLYAATVMGVLLVLACRLFRRREF
jgi:ABC-type transport system involved in multi-copper enzyme maturation permease subunit